MSVDSYFCTTRESFGWLPYLVFADIIREYLEQKRILATL